MLRQDLVEVCVDSRDLADAVCTLADLGACRAASRHYGDRRY